MGNRLLMALQVSLTDSDTLAEYPNAYVRIDDVTLSIISGGTMDLGVYFSQAAAQTGGKPIRKMPITLSPAEAGKLRAAGLALLYALLKSRPEFSAAIDV